MSRSYTSSPHCTSMMYCETALLFTVIIHGGLLGSCAMYMYACVYICMYESVHVCTHVCVCVCVWHTAKMLLGITNQKNAIYIHITVKDSNPTETVIYFKYCK
jgi:hypothetical protein